MVNELKYLSLMWDWKKLSVFAVVLFVRIINNQSFEQKDHPIKYIFFSKFSLENGEK